jgi:hypothetical protein
MNCNKIRRFIFILTFFFVANSAFAIEEYVSDTYKQIDKIFIVQSEPQLYDLLDKNKEDKYYYLIENYTMKKIRRLIVKNDYEFAMDAVIVVIENNLENEEAVEMYSIISDAYEIQKQYEAELEYKRQLELARLEQEKEKHRVSVEKEYVSAQKNEGGSVYVSGKETKLSSYWWKGSLGIVDFSYIMDANTGVNALNYGINIDVDYEYTLNNLIVGFDLTGSFKFLSLGKEKDMIPLLVNLDVGPKLGFTKLSKNLFLRAGFTAMLASGMHEQSGVIENFITPYIGINYQRFMIGNINISAALDYYAGHLYTPGINFAMGGELNFAFPFAEMEKIKLNLNIGLKDKFLLKESGIENRASIILAIGVENAIK